MRDQPRVDDHGLFPTVLIAAVGAFLLFPPIMWWGAAQSPWPMVFLAVPAAILSGCLVTGWRWLHRW